MADYGGLAAYHAAVARHDAPWPRAQLLAAAGAERPIFAPGTGWAYSNIGYLFVREAIEAATGVALAEALHRIVLAPLGLSSARLATTPADCADLFWPDLKTYDPGWVFHGCLIGNPVDAARLLHALLCGKVLRAETLRLMQEAHALGGVLPGRPWTRCGYALGLMAGEMGPAGRAIGHSGGGPHCVNAVYHFPDLAVPVTIASFTHGAAEGVAEYAAARMAMTV